MIKYHEARQLTEAARKKVDEATIAIWKEVEDLVADAIRVAANQGKDKCTTCVGKVDDPANFLKWARKAMPKYEVYITDESDEGNNYYLTISWEE